MGKGYGSVIHNRENAKQLIDYSRMQQGGMYPSDVDGVIEYHGKAYVFLEYKYSGYSMPVGQKLMYQRMADDLSACGKPVCVMLCSHGQKDPAKDIDGAAARVTAIYWRGEWRKVRQLTAREWVASFFAWVDLLDVPPFV